MLVAPVNVLLRERVTMPAPDLVMPTLPPSIAPTLPACRSKLVADVSVPLVPVIEPDNNCTPATVSLFAPISSVPPATTTLAVSAIWSARCSTAEPPEIVRLPAIELAPVVFRLSVPALTVVKPV